MAATGLEDHNAHVMVYYMSRLWIRTGLAVLHKPLIVLATIS